MHRGKSSIPLVIGHYHAPLFFIYVVSFLPTIPYHLLHLFFPKNGREIYLWPLFATHHIHHHHCIHVIGYCKPSIRVFLPLLPAAYCRFRLPAGTASGFSSTTTALALEPHLPLPSSGGRILAVFHSTGTGVYQLQCTTSA